jgi:hypothetical protein
MSKFVVLVSLALSSFMADAAPVTWTLNGIVFDDGGTATGSFIYDVDTDMYSAINITTQGGDALAFPGDSYTQLFTENASTSESLQTQPVSGNHGFGMKFETSLTDSGGVIDIVLGNVISVEINLGGPGSGFLRNIAAGSVSAVPVPAAVWLFGSALAGLGWFRRKA